jgi:hypothetical protein
LSSNNYIQNNAIPAFVSAIEIQNIREKGIFLKRQQGLNGEELIPGHLTLAFSSLCIHKGYNLTG